MTPHPSQGLLRTFVDTSAYFAFTSSQDAFHQSAQTIALRLAAERWRLFTTNFVVAETHALLLARLGRVIALNFLREIDRSSTTALRVSPADEERAREILVQYDDKNFSLTDATSFAVMERFGILHALAFDRNFAQYGLSVLSVD